MARRNHPAQGLINQDDFVAHGVGVRHGLDGEAPAQGLPVFEAQLFGRMDFDAQHGPFRPQRGAHGLRPFGDLVQMPLQNCKIGIEQRLALRGVDDDRIDSVGEFHVGRKTRAPGPDDARRSDFFPDFMQFHSTLPLPLFRS